MKYIALIFLVLIAFGAGIFLGLRSPEFKAPSPAKTPIKEGGTNPYLELQKKEFMKEAVKEKSKTASTKFKPNSPPEKLVQEEPLNKKLKAYENKTRRGYTLVIASFKKEVNAAQYAYKISLKEKDAFYFKKTIQGKIWYRVAIGAFSLKSTAESLKKELSYFRYGRDSVISRIPN